MSLQDARRYRQEVSARAHETMAQLAGGLETAAHGLRVVAHGHGGLEPAEELLSALLSGVQAQLELVRGCMVVDEILAEVQR